MGLLIARLLGVLNVRAFVRTVARLQDGRRRRAQSPMIDGFQAAHAQQRLQLVFFVRGSEACLIVGSVAFQRVNGLAVLLVEVRRWLADH